MTLIGTPGFSRVVYCNDPEAEEFSYCDNYVTTTKYTLISFLPKSLFEQFRRIANLYFLLCAFMSFTPISPNSPVSSVLPLSVVVAVTMVKELVEDWKRRKQDVEMNNRKTKVHRGNGNFEDTKWMDLRVGDIVKVEKDEYFPADLILLSSGYDEAICYVETTNLDGETNLKLKQALEVTLGLNEDSVFKNFRSVIRCEDPNAKLYSFIGSLDLGGQKHPLSSQQLRLRESKLRNTDYIFGVSIFTGHDTKVSQNSVDPPSKRSRIERRTDEFEGRTLRMCYAIPKRKKASPPAQLKPAVLYNLFVANLPFAARDQDLKELFKSGGSEVVSAEVIFNENPRRPSGYGFVSFKTKKEADEALTTFEGKELMGRSIRVARSKRFVKPESETNFQSEDGDDLPADSSDDSEQIETVDNL